jgi:hypothetical protein
MYADIVSLYKILKDNTNQKILVLINEAGSLSYADLIEKSEILGETLLNYHLKVLGDLLNKNAEGQYVLTEKGQYALKILKEKPEQLKKFERKKQKQNGVYVGLGYVITLIVALLFYSQGYIERKMLYRVVLYTSAPVIFYISYIVSVASLTSESVRKKRNMFANFAFALLGGPIGALIAMAGLAIVSVISVSMGGPSFWHVTDSYAGFNDIYFGSSFVIGCIAGYYICKKFIIKRL